MPRTDSGVSRPGRRLQQTPKQEMHWARVVVRGQVWNLLKLGPTGFSGGLDVRFEKKRGVKGDSKDFGQNN